MAWSMGTIGGIPLRIHWSLLAILPFFAYLMATFYFDGPDLVGVLWGGALALTLFASVLAHELSHSFMAIRLGTRVRSILLMPLGGVSQMETPPDRPGHEFKITVVGPLTNFVLAVPLLAAAYAAPVAGHPQRFLLWSGWLNVGVGAFNLFLPAFPMDGGRLLRAALATRLGGLRATHVAAGVGRTVAVAMGIFGILTFAAGGIWFVLIAIFIFAGAGAEEDMTTARHLLRERRARDLMTTPVEAVGPDDDVESLLDTMLRTRHLALPVTREGQILGCVGHDAVAAVPTLQRPQVHVRDIMGQDIVTIDVDASAMDVMQKVQDEAHGHVIVTEDNVPVGIVSATDLQRFVKILQARGPEDRR